MLCFVARLRIYNVCVRILFINNHIISLKFQTRCPFHVHNCFVGICARRGSGKGRAREAAAAAISSPLLDFPIERARGVVFNIVGGDDLTLQEVQLVYTKSTSRVLQYVVPHYRVYTVSIYWCQPFTCVVPF